MHKTTLNCIMSLQLLNVDIFGFTFFCMKFEVKVPLSYSKLFQSVRITIGKTQSRFPRIEFPGIEHSLLELDESHYDYPNHTQTRIALSHCCLKLFF